jgi:hypothetical protein
MGNRAQRYGSIQRPEQARLPTLQGLHQSSGSTFTIDAP